MVNPKIDIWIGAGAIVFALFLFFIAIPYGVSTPGAVPKIVLSPIFWPEILAGAFAVVGLMLVAAGLKTAPLPPLPETERAGMAGVARLVAMAVMMAVYFWLIPHIGMVWASVLAFFATSLLVRTRHPVIAVIVALLLPLILYAFFYHVAGVAIPQGKFLELP